MTTDTAPVAPVAPTFMTKDQAIAILAEFGLSHIEQSGFLKVAAPGGRIYIAATKTTRRVDISGFEVDPSLGKVPHCGPFGKVKQQLRLGASADEAMSNLRALLAVLVALPAPEPKVKAPKAAEPTTEGDVPEAPVVDTTAADRLASIQKTKEIALRMGASLSPKLLAEEAALLETVAQAAE